MTDMRATSPFEFPFRIDRPCDIDTVMGLPLEGAPVHLDPGWVRFQVDNTDGIVRLLDRGEVDMRATERLLEVIEACGGRIVDRGHGGLTGVDAMNAIDAVRELRRRGDTLVRAADLRLVLEEAEQGWDDEWSGGSAEAIERMQNALGGRMR